MPLKINAQTITSIFDEKLTNKPDLRSDAHSFAAVLRKIVRVDPVDCDATSFTRQLQGAITEGISASNRLLDGDAVSALGVSGVNALERFAVLHFSSVQRSFLRGLESVVGTADYDADRNVTQGGFRSQQPRALHNEIQRILDLMMGLDVPYTLSVNPGSHLGTYYQGLS